MPCNSRSKSATSAKKMRMDVALAVAVKVLSISQCGVWVPPADIAHKYAGALVPLRTVSLKRTECRKKVRIELQDKKLNQQACKKDTCKLQGIEPYFVKRAKDSVVSVAPVGSSQKIGRRSMARHQAQELVRDTTLKALNA
eukprot:6213395-Pleurochrysis_carterae.AAC.3